MIIFSWADYSGAVYGEHYRYPMWADILGWFMSICSIIWIPVAAVYKLWREEGTLWQRIKYLSLPTEEWGPALVAHRALVDYVEGFIVDPWNRHKTPDDKATMGTWGMNTSEQHSQTNNNIAVSRRYLKYIDTLSHYQIAGILQMIL